MKSPQQLVGAVAFSSQPTFTRTADTNVYAANDVIGGATASGGAVLEFTNIGPANGVALITDCDLLIGLTAVTSGMTSFRLWLANATIPSALGDNAAYDLPSGDRAVNQGYIDLGTPVDIGSSLFVQSTGVNKIVKLGATGSLFAYLVTIGTFTPASGTTYMPRLSGFVMGQ